MMRRTLKSTSVALCDGRHCVARRNASFTWLVGGYLASTFGGMTTTPFVAIALVGVAARLSTLYFTFVCERIAARYCCALPELHRATEEFEKIANAPYVLKLEHDMALKKLTRDRARILQQHGGKLENLMVISMISPTVLAMWAIGPVKAMAAHLSAQGALLSSPLALQLQTVGGMVLDPSYLLVATMACANVKMATWCLQGCSDRSDEGLQQRWTRFTVACYAGGLTATAYSALVASGVLGTSPMVAAVTALLAKYYFVVPFSLGVSTTTLLLKQPLLHLYPFRLVMDIPDRPATHGTYGSKGTGLRAELQKAYEEIRGEITPSKYELYMEELEKDCDRRIRKSFNKYLGIFGSEEDYWSARAENERRLDAIRNQKMHNESMGARGVQTTQPVEEKNNQPGPAATTAAGETRVAQ